jgi:hypothetical protein
MTSNPVHLKFTKGHVGCDRSADFADSSMVSDPTFAFIREGVRAALQSTLYIFSEVMSNQRCKRN